MDERTPQDRPDAPLAVDAVRAGLAGLRLGWRVTYFPEIGSTNTYAMGLARQGEAEGALVTTDHQSAGRGRMGRVWQALPNQQVILSLLLRPRFPPQFLMMVSALAVVEAIEQTTGLPAALKWPNDVLVNERKVCGILIETSEGAAVVGMGLNANGSLADDPELGARAITLADALGQPVSREALIVALLTRFDGYYGALQAPGTDGMFGRQMVRDAWRARLGMLGRRVAIRQRAGGQDGEPLVGLAEGVDADGALIVLRDDGKRTLVTWGDVEALG